MVETERKVLFAKFDEKGAKMKRFEFQASLGAGQVVCVPASIAAQIAHDQPFQVVVLVPEPDDDEAWRRLTTEEFAQGYGDSDAIYDALSAG